MKVQAIAVYNQNRISNQKHQNYKTNINSKISFQQNFASKFPKFIIEQGDTKIVNPYNVNSRELSIIDSIKKSKAFQKFFEKYSVDSVVIEKHVYNGYCEVNSINIYHPQLKKDSASQTEKKSLREKITDFFYPAKEVQFGKEDCVSFYLEGWENDVSNISYKDIMKTLYNKNASILEEEKKY